MAAAASALSRSDLFSGVPEEIIRREILPHGQTQEYSKGQFLINPQERVSRFGIIVTGKIHVMHIFPDGSYSLTAVLDPGEIVGADLVCTKSQIAPYHAMAAAAAQVCYFPITLLTKPGTLPENLRLNLLNHMLILIANENMKKEYRIAILSQKGLREKIVTYLTMQANRLRRSTFAVTLSREEMASFLCVNRSALSHELSLMQQEGLISFWKNEFTLHFMENLR